MSLSPSEPVGAGVCPSAYPTPCGLTPTQEKVLAQLFAGATLNAAAASAGVHRNTIAYWRRSTPAFGAELHHAQYEQAIYWRAQAETLASVALETIRVIMTDPQAPASVRLKAALTILEKVCTPPPPAPETVHKNAQKADLSDAESVHDNAPGSAQTAADAQNGQNEMRETKPISFPSLTFVRSGPKIGRNDPCPCASGKKFKHCCISRKEPAHDHQPVS